MWTHSLAGIVRGMAPLYRITPVAGLGLEPVYKIGDPWPDPDASRYGIFTIGAIFYVPGVTDEDGDQIERECFELWAAPSDPNYPAEGQTFCMKIWFDGPMRTGVEDWKFMPAMEAVALRLGAGADEDDDDQEPVPPPNGNQQSPVGATTTTATSRA